MIESSSTFSGPIFIVGMPRSGTKLLRGLLLEHESIGIPLVETGFLPYWKENWDQYGDLSIYENFEQFYQMCIELPYFFYMQHDGKRHLGSLIPCEKWFQMCRSFTIAGVFEGLIRHDAGVDYESNKIWGDKSPGYISHVRLLKEIFPEAKVIHIVRDARDYCLSIKKAWNKNMMRAAQRWSDQVKKIKEDVVPYQHDYFEIKYEDLLENPEDSLKHLCDFLQIDFSPNMVKLSIPVENLGDSQGQNRIVRDNKDKYLTKMSPKTLKRIEGLTGEMLQSYGYNLNFPLVSKRLSKIEMVWYQLFDAVNLVQSKTQEMEGLGFFGALKFHVKHFLTSKTGGKS